MKKIWLFVAAAVLPAFLMITNVQATIILQDDFEDASPPTADPNWTFANGLFGATATFTSNSISLGGAPGIVQEVEADVTVSGGWFAIGLQDLGGPLPTTDLTMLSLVGEFTDVNGTFGGGDVEFRIESLDSLGGTQTGRIEFDAPVASGGTFTQLGGLLSDGTPTTFDASAPDFRIVWGINDGDVGTGVATHAVQGNNILFETVPEPSSLALFALVGLGMLIARRQS